MEKIAALEDAIEKNSLVGIYSVFYTIAHGDPNFSTGKFRTVMDYVKSKDIAGFIQEFDGEKFEEEEKWDEDYWALIASSLVDNFCMERVDHLEAVGKKVYPIKVVEQSKPVINMTNAYSNAVKGDVVQTQTPKRTIQSETQTTAQGKRILTEQQKRGVKFDHANRTYKDDGGFLSKIFGPRR